MCTDDGRPCHNVTFASYKYAIMTKPVGFINPGRRTLMHELANCRFAKAQMAELVDIMLTKGYIIDEQTETSVDLLSNEISNGGSTPLMCALYENNSILAEILVERGANVDAVNSLGKPVFYYARIPEMRNLLLANGAVRTDMTWPQIAREESEYYSM